MRGRHLFLASTATELSQYWWPRGFFDGTFDPLDILAYGVGIAVCYIADKRSATALPALEP